MKGTSLIKLCLSVGLALASPTGAQTLYKPIDLGTLPGGTYSTAVGDGVNNPSRVVGFADTVGGAIHGFRWTSKAGMTDLGTLGGTNTHAYGINDGGQIVGQSDTSAGGSDAFLYTAGMTDLGTLGAAPSLSQASAINFSNLTQAFTQIAGWSLSPDGTAFHAVIWGASLNIVDIGTLGGTNSFAFGNNSAGQVVGSSQTANDATTDAFVWDSVHGMQDLGTLGGTIAQANGINSNGAIVGFSSLPGDTQFDAFLISGATMTDLGNPGPFFSQANAINDPGTVVGFFVTPDGSDTHAFRWTSKAGFVDLNSLLPANSGWDLQSANSISNNGKIVGTGKFNGGFHAFLLVPVH